MEALQRIKGCLRLRFRLDLEPEGTQRPERVRRRDVLSTEQRVRLPGATGLRQQQPVVVDNLSRLPVAVASANECLKADQRRHVAASKTARIGRDEALPHLARGLAEPSGGDGAARSGSGRTCAATARSPCETRERCRPACALRPTWGCARRYLVRPFLLPPPNSVLLPFHEKEGLA